MSFCLLSLLAHSASAGERTFAHAYGYGTVPKGGVEVEEYATVSVPRGGDPSWEHQVELELGITDRLEGGLYLVAGQGPGEGLSFSGYKARLRYRFGAAGVAPVDVAAYLEYIGSADLEDHGVEAKLILAKDVGRFVSALNVEYKVTFEPGEIEHELEPTAGAGFRVTDGFTLGAEGKMEVEIGHDEVLGWVGPTVHLAGEGGRLWWTVSALVPLGEETAEEDGWVVRSLVAVNL